jgi:hypothetical protein
MNDLNISLALAYKVPRITKFIIEDIKLIKKLNQVLSKLERTEKERYILESINILRQLNNVFDFDVLYPALCELVDIRFHSTMILLNKNMNVYSFEKFIKKVQELADDES